MSAVGDRIRAERPRGATRSAARAVDVLTLLADEGRPLSTMSIARACAIPRSSTYHLLNTLAERGFARYDPDARGWVLGDRARALVEPPTLGRMLQTLDAFDHGVGDLDESELCRRTGMTRGRLRPVVAELTAHGLLIERDERFALGARLTTIAARVGPVDRLRRGVRPHLVELAHRTGETANLLIIERDEAVYLDQVESHHALRHVPWVGRRIALAGSAAGAALRNREGPVVVRDGVEPGVTAIVCPVATDGSPPAAIGVTAPTVRMGRRALAACTDAVRECAAAVGAAVSDTGRSLAPAGPDRT